MPHRQFRSPGFCNATVVWCCTAAHSANCSPDRQQFTQQTKLSVVSWHTAHMKGNCCAPCSFSAVLVQCYCLTQAVAAHVELGTGVCLHVVQNQVTQHLHSRHSTAQHMYSKCTGQRVWSTRDRGLHSRGALLHRPLLLGHLNGTAALVVSSSMVHLCCYPNLKRRRHEGGNRHVKG